MIDHLCPTRFVQRELTELIDGGKEKTEERKRLEAIFLDSRQVENILITILMYDLL